MKYILVTGGVLSGIGKGIIASSTAMIMKAMGLRVTSIKIDPYLNIDAGTMSPFEHGEVFVLDDGGEVDLDLGNYERFLDVKLNRENNITTGKIYNLVIEKEREGKYLGKTVQVVPHVAEEIQSWVERVSHVAVDGMEGEPDVCVIELGGTVGDIESMTFVEAMRQFQFRVGTENFCLMHVSLVPVIGVVGEQKTKPSQQSVRELRALGLSPDFIMCRSSKPLTQETQRKISQFCHVAPANVIGVHDVSNIYRVPLLLYQQNVANILLNRLKIQPKVDIPTEPLDNEAVPYWLNSWKAMADRIDRISSAGFTPIRIAMVGKYTGLSDAYLSVIKSLEHACMSVERKMVIDWIEAADLVPNDSVGDDKHDRAWELLRGAHGILVPGGFGDRGVEGMILAANYARVNNRPYLGICLGMQVAVIEFARNVLGWADANSEEFTKTCSKKVVIFMPEVSKTHMGATMRLGARDTVINDPDTQIAKLYGVTKAGQTVEERHRHRYEVNPEYIQEIDARGLHFVGKDTSNVRMEIVELKEHDYYVAVQFHPEFKSRPQRPSPPFVGLINACLKQMSKQ
eukprot:gene14368-16955_t